MEQKIRICDFCQEKKSDTDCFFCKKDICKECKSDLIFSVDLKTKTNEIVFSGRLNNPDFPQKNELSRELNIRNYGVNACKEHGKKIKGVIRKRLDELENMDNKDIKGKKGNINTAKRISDLLMKELMLENIEQEDD